MKLRPIPAGIGIEEQTVERRYYPRLELTLEVEVYRYSTPLGRCQTSDISLDGLFVKTGPSGLKRNDVVRLRLGICGETHGLQGIVAHVTVDGVGLMLQEMNREVFRALYDVFKLRRVPLGRTIFGMERRQEPATPASLKGASRSDGIRLVDVR